MTSIRSLVFAGVALAALGVAPASGQTFNYRYTMPSASQDGAGPPKAQCLNPLTGDFIEHGAAITAFQAPTVPWDATCLSEARACDDGVLGGSFDNPACTVETALACSLPWGGTLGHAQAATAYQNATVPFESECVSEQRTCLNGDLSGNWIIQACSNLPQDLTPTAFTVSAQINLNPGNMAQPAPIQVAGITGNVPASLENYDNQAMLRVCADAACASIIQDWVAGPVTVRNNQYLLLRSRSSSSLSTTLANTVTVGTYSTAFNSTTSSSYCGGVGGVCEDGTIYAGVGDGKPLFVSCDAGMVWNGSACTGARNGALRWGDDVQVGTLCGADCGGGKARSAALAALGPQYQMANYCENMVFGGHSDWYLPSRNEVQQLYNVRFSGSLNGTFYTDSGYFPQYASSSEALVGNYSVWLFFSGGGASHMPKSYQGSVNTHVRCVRSPA